MLKRARNIAAPHGDLSRAHQNERLSVSALGSSDSIELFECLGYLLFSEIEMLSSRMFDRLE